MKFLIRPVEKNLLNQSSVGLSCKIVCTSKCLNVCNIQTIKEDHHCYLLGCCPQGGRTPKGAYK